MRKVHQKFRHPRRRW